MTDIELGEKETTSMISKNYVKLKRHVICLVSASVRCCLQ